MGLFLAARLAPELPGVLRRPFSVSSVLYYPLNPAKRTIDRVIGVEGDTLRIIDGDVYVNDKRIAEPFRRRSPEPVEDLFRCVGKGDRRGRTPTDLIDGRRLPIVQSRRRRGTAPTRASVIHPGRQGREDEGQPTGLPAFTRPTGSV
jgi:hypothetical protein